MEEDSNYIVLGHHLYVIDYEHWKIYLKADPDKSIRLDQLGYKDPYMFVAQNPKTGDLKNSGNDQDVIIPLPVDLAYGPYNDDELIKEINARGIEYNEDKQPRYRLLESFLVDRLEGKLPTVVIDDRLYQIDVLKGMIKPLEASNSDNGSAELYDLWGWRSYAYYDLNLRQVVKVEVDELTSLPRSLAQINIPATLFADPIVDAIVHGHRPEYNILKIQDFITTHKAQILPLYMTDANYAVEERRAECLLNGDKEIVVSERIYIIDGFRESIREKSNHNNIVRFKLREAPMRSMFHFYIQKENGTLCHYIPPGQLESNYKKYSLPVEAITRIYDWGWQKACMGVPTIHDITELTNGMKNRLAGVLPVIEVEDEKFVLDNEKRLVYTMNEPDKTISMELFRPSVTDPSCMEVLMGTHSRKAIHPHHDDPFKGENSFRLLQLPNFTHTDPIGAALSHNWHPFKLLHLTPYNDKRTGSFINLSKSEAMVYVKACRLADETQRAFRKYLRDAKKEYIKSIATNTDNKKTLKNKDGQSANRAKQKGNRF